MRMGYWWESQKEGAYMNENVAAPVQKKSRLTAVRILCTDHPTLSPCESSQRLRRPAAVDRSL
jgi:hypothetical protein